ncbi:MAG: hypothetical protein LBM25_02750 [Bacteroidales bacterium]|jgi:hypothetical protein|nr:hypothetical protein [Bacteroidales bacterium]
MLLGAGKNIVDKFLISIVALGLTLVDTYNYFHTDLALKIQDILGMVLFFSYLLVVYYKFCKNTIHPISLFVCCFFGIVFYLGIYILQNFKTQALLLTGLACLVMGALSGMIFVMFKNKSVRVISILISVIYAFFHCIFIYDYVKEITHKL